MRNQKLQIKYALFLFLIIFSFESISYCTSEESNISNELEKRLQAWDQYLRENPRISDLTGNQYYQDIISMGLPVLPYIMEKVDKGSWALSDAVSVITKKKFEEDERPKDYTYGSKAYAKLAVQWYPNARKETNKLFSQRYLRWSDLKNKKEQNKSKEELEKIRALGIAALPLIMAKVQQGDTELIPVISKLTKDKIKSDATAVECLEWWKQNKEDWLIPFPNKQPKANAGNKQTVSSGQNVQLDGSESSDDDKDELTYQWKQISGPEVKLSDAQRAKPSFTAPKVDKETELEFELIVSDGAMVKQVHPLCESGQSNPCKVKITIKQ